MKFLDYVYQNKEGLVFIDKLRNTIKNICREHILDEKIEVTEEDIDKLYLMVEYNFLTPFFLEELNMKEKIDDISLENADLKIGMSVGTLCLMNGIEKNKRETYSDILKDVMCELLSLIDDYEELSKYSEIANRVYLAILLIESGERDENYFCFTDEELQRCISEMYEFLLKGLIEF